MRHTVSMLLLLTALSFLQFRALAQNYLYGTGNQTWGINLPIEHGFINVANGAVHIEIPIATLPQRGSLALNERLVYDSRIWQIVTVGGNFQFQPNNVPVPYSGVSPVCTGNPQAACTSNTPGTVSFTNLSVPNSMAGWRFVQGNETGVIQQYVDDDNTLQDGSLWDWGWTDPSGTTHYFPVTTGTVWCPSCAAASGSGYAIDGSGFYITVTNYTNATVFDSNGNEVYPSIIDRNGNTFSSDSNGNLTDTLGRTPVTQSTSGNTITYNVLTVGGQTKPYTITTETLTLNTSFQQSGVSDYQGSITAIKSIGLPDGSSYSFTYDTGTYGELQSITLPTGGTISFGYQNYLDSYQNQNRWLQSYSGGLGSYSFSPSVVTQCSGPNDTGCQEKVDVIDGSENKTTYLLTLNNGAWNSQTTVYSGWTKQYATPIVSTTTTYDFSNSTPPWLSVFGAETMWVTASSTTTTLSDTGQSAQTTYSYSYPWSGKPSAVKRWDYYTGTPSTLPTKETDYTYGYIVNHAYFPTNIAQLDSGGNTVANTAINYDQSTPSPASGATALAAAPGGTVRGNATSITSGTGSQTTTCMTYDTAGQVSNVTDGNTNSSTSCTAATTANSISYTYTCSDAYAHIVSYPLAINGQNLQTTTSYDCSSGAVTASQDMNGVVNKFSTTFTYFSSGLNIGRLKDISYPDNGSTTFAYPSATEVDQTDAINQTTSRAVQSFLDTYGRSYQSVVTAPEGSLSSEITYDAMGRPYSITNMHLQGATSSTDGTTYISYDPLGRTKQTTMPDNSWIQTKYSGAVATVADSLSHNKQLTYDAFHRLTQVLEQDSNGALTYETDYTYNALDEMTEVDQWGGAKNSSGARKRFFAYDSLGHKIAASVPEGQSSVSAPSLTCSGATGQWTSCYSYDRNSNLKTVTENRAFTATYSYDTLNRIVKKQYSDSATPWSCYLYDSASNGTGLLSNAWTQPYSVGQCASSAPTSSASTAPNNGFWTKRSILSYDAMGRITAEQQFTPSYGSAGSPYTMRYSYDLAGNIYTSTNGVSSTPSVGTLSFMYTTDSAGRLQTITSNWNDAAHPANLFSAQTGQSLPCANSSASAFAPLGGIMNAALGNGILLNRTYDSLSRVVCENDTGIGAPPKKGQ